MNKLRVGLLACCAITLVACTDDGERFSHPNADAILEADAALQDDAFNRPEKLIPVSLQIQTLEEQPVTGTFDLRGQLADNQTPTQTFSIVSEPANGTVEPTPDSSQFTYVPDPDFFGSDKFVFSNIEGELGSVIIKVINVNDPPTIFAELPRVIEQGETYEAALTANDPDNDPLNYESRNLPGWLTLEASTGMLTGTPTIKDVGLFDNIEFRVVDVDGLVGEVTGVRIEVIEDNGIPSINIDRFPKDLDAGESIELNLFPDDPDDDAVDVAFEANEYLTVSINDGVIKVVAAEVAEVTDVNLVLQATDIRGGVARSLVPMTLHPVNGTGRGRTLYGRGASGEGFHLVVLGDGYREDQQSKFRGHVEDLVELMLADVGMSTHFSAWNVHMVETPSQDSGIDDDATVDVRDTVFKTGYYCKRVRRLICGDTSEIYSVAVTEYPNFDQILVLVNDSRYGGSGGDIAIASTDSLEIALHEMGHSVAGLADEYVDQYIEDSSIPEYTEGDYANVSINSVADEVPWRHWLSTVDVEGLTEPDMDVGVFEGAFYRANGFYRPTNNSLMRSYDGKLGPVNSEQWALSVYREINSVLDVSPVSRELNVTAGEVVDFSVLPMFDSTVQAVQWRLDSRVIPDSGTERPSVALSFPAGEFNVSVTVRDISGLIRKPEPHNGVFQWSWTVFVQ